ncbi:MAG: PDZ domain-containing protein [Actinomycetota bacterium]|nr:PDZ domain-containing protein [Actinomycetota bacterium]
MHWGPSEDDPDDQGAAGGGWVPPEARTWRHPSELHMATVAAVLTTTHGWRRSAALAVGGAALLAIAAGALLLAKTGSSPGAATLDTMPVGTAAVTPCCTLSPVLTRDAEQAVVSIEPTVGPGATGCGVVVASRLVVTTEAALAGARSVRVVAATGRMLGGTVVAADHDSGIVLLRLSAPLPSAQMDVGDTLGSGTPALAMALRPGTGNHPPKPVWTSATVVSVGEPPPGAPPSAMAAITVRGASVPVMPGEPLVDRHGRVEGILASAWGSERSFLPMSFVVGVTNDLATIGKVQHGWLGVTDATPEGASGAEVVWVDPRGAAAHALRAGDVIVRADGWRVHSASQLRSMLYVLAPGTRVSLVARRGSRVIRAVVELAPSP